MHFCLPRPSKAGSLGTTPLFEGKTGDLGLQLIRQILYLSLNLIMVSSPKTLIWDFPTEPTATPFLWSRAQPTGMAVQVFNSALPLPLLVWKVGSCQWLVWPVFAASALWLPVLRVPGLSCLPTVFFSGVTPGDCPGLDDHIPVSVRSVDLCALATPLIGLWSSSPLPTQALPSCLQSPSPTSIPLGLA